MAIHTTALAYFDDSHFEAQVLIEVYDTEQRLETTVLGHSPTRGLTGWKCKDFYLNDVRDDCQRFIDNDPDIQEQCRLALQEAVAA